METSVSSGSGRRNDDKLPGIIGIYEFFLAYTEKGNETLNSPQKASSVVIWINELKKAKLWCFFPLTAVNES
jgi:hypothetical protein